MYILQSGLFCQIFDVFFRLYNPFPPKPKTPFTYRTHAQRKKRKVSKMKGTYILNIVALLLFENLQRIY